MDSVYAALFLGIVQGLSEFLPISSSGHLIIGPWLFGFTDPGLSFDVALHVGTLIAVMSYFWQDWIDIFRAFLGHRVSPVHPEYQRRFLGFLILATIPGVVTGLFLDKLAETALRAPLLIAGTLFVGGLLLYWVDSAVREVKTLSDMTMRESLFIGLGQALALIPGISRSGITMTVARLFGYDRVGAARFSFLLSTPIILGAAILKFHEILAQAGNLAFWVGVIASALAGYLAIRYLLAFLTRHGFAVFFWYRTLLALIIVFYFSHH